MKRFRSLLLAIALTSVVGSSMLTVGCAKKVSTPPNPSTPVPIEVKISKTLAILSEANLGAIQVVTLANKQSLLDDTTTAEILRYNALVVQSVKSGLIIKSSDKTAAQKIAAILALVNQIRNNPVVSKLVATADPKISGVIASLTTIQLLVEQLASEVNQ